MCNQNSACSRWKSLKKVRRRPELVRVSSRSFTDDLSGLDVLSICNSLSGLLNNPSAECAREVLSGVGVIDSKDDLGCGVVSDSIQKTSGDFGQVANALVRKVESEAC